MSDKELNELLTEMDFSSPLRYMYDEDQASKPSALNKEPDDSKRKKVLISDVSLNTSENLIDDYGEEFLIFTLYTKAPNLTELLNLTLF